MGFFTRLVVSHSCRCKNTRNKKDLWTGCEKDKKIWIPKSTQSKSVGSFQKESKKIYFILSRKIHSNVFTVLEYEAVGGLYMKLKECLPKEYKINISEMSNNGSKDKTKLEMEQESKKNDGKNRPNIL